jgi:BolA protein
MDRVAEIRQRLEQRFSPEILEIEDQSHLHAGHVGARDGGGHFRVRICAADLASMNRVKRQRAVYAAVGDMMPSEIHALSIVFD